MKVRMNLFSAIIALLAITVAPILNAQTRFNDKDVQALLKNLHNDAKAFRGPYRSALHKSAIRNTGQEKDERALADTFLSQTDDLYKHFKNKKRAGDQILAVIDTSHRINHIVYSQNLGPVAITAWEKVRADIRLVAQAWGIATPSYRGGSEPMPASAGP